jgi:hypothetical protein
MFLNFKDTKYIETCMPNLSGQRRWRRSKRQALERIYCAYIIVSIVTLVVIPYKLYRAHHVQIKCDVLLEVSKAATCLLSDLSRHSIGLHLYLHLYQLPQ